MTDSCGVIDSVSQRANLTLFVCPRHDLSHGGLTQSQEIHNFRTGTIPYDKPELRSGEGYSGKARP